MFNKHGTDRLTAWRDFRIGLETSDNPLKDVAEFWSHAPFVSSYLDPLNSSEWPDPWHLVLDNRLDELAIALGILYTIKLTERFIDTPCEIHTSLLPGNTEPSFWVVVAGQYVLNYEYRAVVEVKDLPEVVTNIIWSGVKLP